MNRDSLEEKLELAPKYGQNQAWLLLNSVLDDDDKGSERSKQRPKTPQREKYSPLKAVPKTVLPNIDAKPRAKIPRGPRINWLNRSIALYLHYVGQEFLGFRSSTSLSQEVKFNISFCRCAIKAAVAHELHAFNSNTNAQKYHGFLTKQQPKVEHIDYELLRKLCLQYSQPLPVPHPQNVQHEASGKVDATKQQELACDTVGDANQAELAGEEAQNTLLDAETEDQTAEPNVGDTDFSRGLAPDATAPSEPSGGTEQHVADGTDTSGATARRKARSPSIEGCNGSARKLKRLKESCEEVTAGPGTVNEYVDALFESDEDLPDLDVGGAPDSGEYCEAEGTLDASCEGQAVHDNGSSRKPGARGVADVWTEVREFVAMCLEPWKVSGIVNDEQAEVIMDKCVSKVLGAHAGRKDTAFLSAEGERIQGLVSQYADFIVHKYQKK